MKTPATGLAGQSFRATPLLGALGRARPTSIPIAPLHRTGVSAPGYNRLDPFFAHDAPKPIENEPYLGCS